MIGEPSDLLSYGEEDLAATGMKYYTPQRVL
jgi:hypothetical protein